MKNYILRTGFLIVSGFIFHSCSSSSDYVTEGISVSLPKVTTTKASQIQQTTATSGGIVTDDGGNKIKLRGICWSTTPNPTISSGNLTSESNGTLGTFESSLKGLLPNTLYYVRAYATNNVGTAYGSQISFTTKTSTAALPTVTTGDVTAITQTSATVGGDVTNAGGADVTERGICWAKTASPTIVNNKVVVTGTTGSFTGPLTDLTEGTVYYARAYASNSGGTAYGAQITFTTQGGTSNNGPVGGKAVCDGTSPTVVVAVTSSTGKVWMDRNLGASRAATSATDYEAYGCLYQWGRGNDGHATITWVMSEESNGIPAGVAFHGTTTTLSTSDTPPNGLFITKDHDLPYDWRSPKNDNLWQGASGTNNPCPAGYRIPTQNELKAEVTAYSITGAASAYSSIHKFPLAGSRAFDSGMIRGQGQETFLWTSTTDSGNSYDVLIQQGAVYTNVTNARAGGYAVRCIKN